MKLLMKRYEDCENIQKLGMVIPFTNTDRMTFACPRLWSYQSIQNFVVDNKSSAISYGVVWHKLLEIILLESIEENFVSKDRLNEIVKNNLMSIIEAFYINEIGTEQYNMDFQLGVIDDLKERIENAIVGWWMSWRSLMDDFNVLYVELPLASPVMNNDGDIAKFATYITKEEDFYRPSRIGEHEKSKLMNIPYFKIGKIDVLLEDKRTGDLWICDHKTSSSPSQFENGITFDVQLPSYASLLEWEKNKGILQHLKDRNIMGVVYDISSSKIKGIPALLKSGKLTKAKNSGIASWIYEDAVEKYNLPKKQYAEYIDYLRLNSDKNKNYQRFLYLTREDIDRCTDEDYGIALAMAEKRKKLVEINIDSVIDYNAIAYRYPACQKYNSCAFSSFCLANNHPKDMMLEQNANIKWTEKE